MEFDNYTEVFVGVHEMQQKDYLDVLFGCLTFTQRC